MEFSFRLAVTVRPLIYMPMPEAVLFIGGRQYSKSWFCALGPRDVRDVPSLVSFFACVARLTARPTLGNVATVMGCSAVR